MYTCLTLMKEFVPGTGALNRERSLSAVFDFECQKSNSPVIRRIAQFTRGHIDILRLLMSTQALDCIYLVTYTVILTFVLTICPDTAYRTIYCTIIQCLLKCQITVSDFDLHSA